MARTISDESLNKLEAEWQVSSEMLPKFRDELKAFVSYMEKNKWREIAQQLEESNPGIRRSIIANIKLLEEADMELGKLASKLEGEVSEVEAKFNKSKANKDAAPVGSGSKSGYIIVHPVLGEVPVKGDFGDSAKHWFSGFRGNIVQQTIPVRYSKTVIEELKQELADMGDTGFNLHTDLRIRKDKRDYCVRVTTSDELTIRKM